MRREPKTCGVNLSKITRKVDIMFTLYYSDYCQNQSNCLYPHKIIVTDPDTLRKAILFDHVAACYKDNYRSNQNFISSDCIIMDVDNDHSDEENEWYNMKHLVDTFTDVEMFA